MTSFLHLDFPMFRPYHVGFKSTMVDIENEIWNMENILKVCSQDTIPSFKFEPKFF